MNDKETLLKDIEKLHKRIDELEESERKCKKANAGLTYSEACYRRFFESTTDGILILDAETESIIDGNPYLTKMLGYTPGEFLGKKLWELGAFKDIEEIKTAHAELLREGHIHYEHIPLETKDGRVISAEFVGNVYSAGDRKLVQFSIRDITRRKEAEEALRKSEERYRIIAENARDAIITIDEEGRIMLANPATERIFGYTGAELYDQPLTMLLPGLLESEKKQVVNGNRHLPLGVIEIPGLHRDGHEIPLEISCGEFMKEEKRFFIGIIRDITQRKKAEETIKYQAFHDLLTGLPNRAQLMLRFELESAQAERNNKKIAVLYIDLDRFKVINDSLGHAVGDKVLLAVADRLRASIGKNDALARIGSEEFVILLLDINRAEDAVLFARKLVDIMRKTFRIDAHELYVTASIGISMYPEDSMDAEVLLKNAHAAVSYVKERGRDTYQFFNRAINTRTIERLLLESSLRQTIERGELELHFQPQVDIRTGAVLSYEALVRWNHPELGLLLPSEFIHIAEEIGFITAIDEWVLRAACAQNKAWQDAGYSPLCVAVNISAQQFQEPALVETVTGIVHEAGLDPRFLDIEITEGAAMRDIDTAIRHLRGLHQMGINLSIDDFGTGYSSLNYLKQFPVQKLKIDQSFIRGLVTDADDRTIVNAVIALGHSLKIRVLAEGVETDEQLTFLKENACDEMQGFLFSRPLPAEEFNQLVFSGR